MTMLETLARVLDPYAFRRPDRVDEGYRIRARQKVKEILLALRSPDEGMVEAMFDCPDNNWANQALCRKLFTAAIDHILTSEAGK